MIARSTLYRSGAPPDTGWRRWALFITVLLTAAVSALAVLFVTAAQLTSRATAQHYLARAVDSLLEVDRFVANSWPALQTAAEEGDPIPLVGYPVALQLDPSGLADGPNAVADAISATTASLIYDDGFEVLAESRQAFRLVSRGGAFDGTIGRLTGGGHEVATVGLIVSGSFAILLAMATAAQVRGLSRIGTPGFAIGLGAALLWLAATLVRASFEARADTTADPFAADLWLIAADAGSLLVRNAAIVAIAGGIVAASSIVGGGLLRASETRGQRQPGGYT